MTTLVRQKSRTDVLAAGLGVCPGMEMNGEALQREREERDTLEE
jgi:hypothetical protein